MPVQVKPRGLPKTSGITSLVAANTPVTVYTIPAGRSAIIRKIKYNNRHATASGLLRIGTGAATPITEAVPSVQVLNNSTGELDEQAGIPTAVINAAAATAITAEFTGAIGADPNNLLVQIEVEEYPVA